MYQLLRLFLFLLVWLIWFQNNLSSLFLIMLDLIWIPLIHSFKILIIISHSQAAPGYRSSQTTESCFHGAPARILPQVEWPSAHRTYACKQTHLHPGYHLLLLLLLSFFLVKADKLHQVFPSHLDTKIKSLPNFWLLSSYAKVSKPAPESCSWEPSWGEVVFISGTRLSFLETKHRSINK